MKQRKKEERETRREPSKHQKLYELADRLVEAAEFTAWEYGNTGNFLFN